MSTADGGTYSPPLAVRCSLIDRPPTWASTLLKTCPQCLGTFDADASFCPLDGTALTFPTGQLIAGKYEVLRELGHGGMGVVYLANHVEMARQCALKMLKPEVTGASDALARFHREARNASRISHPNVVAVYDFGKSEDGSAYLAMEYVEGRSLDGVLKETGPLKPRRTARIIWQIANGLTAAHDLQIVHRDLKPANIMLTRYRSWEDFVKVVDFGVAKTWSAKTTSTVTSTGLRVGTPAYMSPEQWLDGVVDHRSDTFSLALIAVEMLSGSPPSMPMALVSGAPRTLDSIVPARSWPEDMKKVLTRALSANPEERQASAAQFAADFVAAVNAWEPPAPGFREPWDERLQTPSGTGQMVARRSRVPVIGVVVAGAALAGLALWAVLSGGDPIAPVATDSGTVAGATTAETTGNPPAGRNTLDQTAREDTGNRQAGTNSGDRQAESTRTVSGSDNKLAVPPPKDQIAPKGPEPGRNPAPKVDSVAMLRGILDLDRPDADSARRVVAIADVMLRGSLDERARIEVWYMLAEAQFVLGRDREGCAALVAARDRAQSSGYLMRSITQLLSARRC